MNFHDPAAELRANVALPFDQARAMPVSVYTSPDFMALEQEHVFAKSWLCAGRADALKDPGDYLTMEIAGDPVLILRDRDGDAPAPTEEAYFGSAIELMQPQVGLPVTAFIQEADSRQVHINLIQSDSIQISIIHHMSSI